MIKASKLHVTDPLVAVGGYGWKRFVNEESFVGDEEREMLKLGKVGGGGKGVEREREREKIMIMNKNNI
jgi:hypothetical protein